MHRLTQGMISAALSYASACHPHLGSVLVHHCAELYYLSLLADCSIGMQVRGSPIDSKRSFLEKKGLTPEEIAEAFERVPETPSTSVPAASSGAGPADIMCKVSAHASTHLPFWQ